MVREEEKERKEERKFLRRQGVSNFPVQHCFGPLLNQAVNIVI